MRTYLIYKATSPSGKIYVGLTSQKMKVRKHQHYSSAKRFQSSGAFQKALLKYRTAMTWDILESGLPDFEAAAARERYYIALFGANISGKGYNHTEGGGQGRPLNSKNSKSNIDPVLRSDGIVFPSARAAALAMGAKCDWAVGKAIKNKGTCGGFSFRRISVEEYESLKETCTPKNVPIVHWTYARTFSDAVRRKISETKKGKPLKHTSKPVRRSDGVLFPSIKEAAISVGTTSDALRYAAQRNQLCHGFLFEIFPKGISVVALLKPLGGQD